MTMSNDDTTLNVDSIDLEDADSESLAEIIQAQNERIARLERWARQMMPSRREAMKAGGLAAALGGAFIGGAEATPGDDGDTVWGSSSNRDDWYADEVDANLVNTETGSVNGQEMIGTPSSGSDPSLTFDSWVTISSTRPSLVDITLKVETDGSTRGLARIEVDETDDGTADYRFANAISEADLGAGVEARDSGVGLVPAGGQVRVVNASDPNNGNAIIDQRAFVL